MRSWPVSLAASAIAFSLMLVFILSTPERTGPLDNPLPRNTAVLEAHREVRDVTPRELVQGPDLQSGMLERLPAVEPPPPPKKPPVPSRWKRPVIDMAGRFISDGKTVTLSGVKPLPLDRQCRKADGTNWPCGRFARTAMRNLVRGRTISCDPGRQETDGEHITTSCKIGDTDLAAWLVGNGWAEPVGAAYAEELKQARKTGLGIWRDQVQ